MLWLPPLASAMVAKSTALTARSAHNPALVFKPIKSRAAITPPDKQIVDSPSGHNRVSLGDRGNTRIRFPSLRDVAVPHRLFKADTMTEAVQAIAYLMSIKQLGIRIPHTDIKLIVAFLRTLTGEHNGNAL